LVMICHKMSAWPRTNFFVAAAITIVALGHCVGVTSGRAVYLLHYKPNEPMFKRQMEPSKINVGGFSNGLYERGRDLSSKLRLHRDLMNVPRNSDALYQFTRPEQSIDFTVRRQLTSKNCFLSVLQCSFLV